MRETLDYIKDLVKDFIKNHIIDECPNDELF